jgi:hypothetical protein
MIENSLSTAPADAMTWWERVKTFDPALLRAILLALAIVLGTVGVEFTPIADRIEVAWTAVFAVIPLIQGWWTRAAVTPAARVVETVDKDGVRVAGPASPLPTGSMVEEI